MKGVTRLLVILLGGAGLFFLQASNCLAADPIKIGIVGAHSGDFSAGGLDTLKAAELVVKGVNAKGGVLGRKVELVPEDDICETGKATSIAKKLASQKIDAVVGHTCSGATKAALGIYKDSNLVVISPSATAPDLTQCGDYPNFLRTVASDDAQVKREVEFALFDLRAKKIAIIHDSGKRGKKLAEFAKNFVAKDPRAQLVVYEGVAPGTDDFSALVQQIKLSRADAVIYRGSYSVAAQIVTLMRKESSRTFFISDDVVKGGDLIKDAEYYAEGVYVSAPKDISKTSMATRAIKAYKKAYGKDPGAYFLNAYAATQVLLNAIEKGGSTESAAISDALHSEYVDTALGKISFDVRGDALGVGFSMFQVRNKEYVQVN